MCVHCVKQKMLHLLPSSLTNIFVRYDRQKLKCSSWKSANHLFSTQAIIKIRSSGFDGGSLSVTSSPSAHRDEEQGRLVACWKSSRHVQPITRSHAMDSCDVFVKLLSSTKVVLFFNL